MVTLDGEAVRFVGDFVKIDKPVSAICLAVQRLIPLPGVGRIRNHRMEIKPPGHYERWAQIIDLEVIEGSIPISIRSPVYVPAFMNAGLNKTG